MIHTRKDYTMKTVTIRPNGHKTTSVKVTNIVTYPGTGTHIIPTILRTIDPALKLHVVHSLSELDRTRFDAVLLLGGVDVSPQFYGEKSTYSQSPDRIRDAVEWAMVRRAMNRDLPIFGICRGHQMLAVAHGGSLYQDIHEEDATYRNHSGPNHELVSVDKRLDRYIPHHHVNSYHHQAVRRVPDGFKVMARAADGIVEAIWRPGALGVQWHPELMAPNYPEWRGIFRWFVEGLR
jgi:putative glutamine amidotransferase